MTEKKERKKAANETPEENASPVIPNREYQTPSISPDQVISGIIDLVHRVGFEDKSSVRKAKTLPFAFVLHQEAIDKIEQYVTSRLELLETIPAKTLTFEGKVGYADMTSLAFPSLQELLQHAGDRKSPTDLTLRWGTLLAVPPLMMAFVTVKFHTNIRKETETLELLHFPIAHIEYEVGGVTNDWVECTTADIEPIFDSIRLKGIYKPLLIFRNRAIVHVLSWSLAFLVEIATIESIGRLFRHESKTNILQEILGTNDILLKFDRYMQYIMSERSFFEPIIVIGSGILLLLVTAIAGFHLLPKLVPRSGILIGLEKSRFQVYENTFKYIIFTLLFGGLGVAILVEIIKAIF
ncbi:hypothetical protein ACFL6H_09955 [Candidatus Latescibacterota bacterium]